MSDWEQLNDYFNKNANAKITADPSDRYVIEDPRDKSNIMAISMILRSGNSNDKVQQTAEKIRLVLKEAGIEAVVGVASGAADCMGICIYSEKALPKSTGIRSNFDGVPVGFDIVRSLDMFKGKPVAPKGPSA